MAYAPLQPNIPDMRWPEDMQLGASGPTPPPTSPVRVPRMFRAYAHTAGSVTSCGIVHFAGLSTIEARATDEDILLDWFDCVRNTRGCFALITFSDCAMTYGRGPRLAKALTAQGWEVSVAGPARNPNSGNMIVQWTWVPDWNEVSAWLNQRPAASSLLRAWAELRATRQNEDNSLDRDNYLATNVREAAKP